MTSHMVVAAAIVVLIAVVLGACWFLDYLTRDMPTPEPLVQRCPGRAQEFTDAADQISETPPDVLTRVFWREYDDFTRRNSR